MNKTTDKKTELQAEKAAEKKLAMVKVLPEIIKDNFEDLTEEHQDKILDLGKSELEVLAKQMIELAANLTTTSNEILTPEQQEARKLAAKKRRQKRESEIQTYEKGKDFIIKNDKGEKIYSAGTARTVFNNAIGLVDGTADTDVKNGSLPWRFVTGFDKNKKPVIETGKVTALFALLKGSLIVERLDGNGKVIKTLTLAAVKISFAEELSRNVIAKRRKKLREEREKKKAAQEAANEAGKNG